MSLYLQHFALRQEPFSIVPDPGFLYPSHQHRQAVAHLKYGLDREGGFILLTGEVGTGKTTLTRTMLQRLPAHVRVAYVLNSKLNETDLLASICDELSIRLPKTKNLSFSKICVDALNQDLLENHAAGKKTLIVIEEAQNLSDEVLETLRLLSNLETNTHKLLHILLVGQPELVEILAKPNLRQLNQRVVSRFHLLPLDKHELANYINHRLHHAGAKGPIFPAECITTIYKLTSGVPRLINLLCHQALLAAYSLGLDQVPAKLVRDAATEILGSENKPSIANKTAGWTVGLVLFLVIILVVGEYYSVLLHNTKSNTVSPVELSQQTVNIDNRSNANTPVKGEELTDVVTDVNNDNFVSPLNALLKLWGVDSGALYTTEEFIDIAERSGLRAEMLVGTDVDKLLSLDRPGVVTIEQSGQLKSQLLVALDDASVTLMTETGTTTLDLPTFQKRWTGRFLFLWQSPSSFSLLRVGDVNKPALQWLQARLAELQPPVDKLITGGRYTEPLQQQIKAFQRQQGLEDDGIVGRHTLMRLNQLTDDAIPTLKGNF
jgi:general secretion pathway protein A